MAIISIFSGKYSGAAEIVKKLEENHGYKLIRDNEVIEAAALKFNENKDIYEKAFFNPPSVFNSFTREKEKAMAELKVAISELLDDNQVFYGFSSLLIPRKINHVVKILTIADQQYRIQNAANLGLSEKTQKKKFFRQTKRQPNSRTI